MLADFLNPFKYWEFTPKDPSDPECVPESGEKPLKDWEKVKLEQAKRRLDDSDEDIKDQLIQNEFSKPKGLEESRSVQAEETEDQSSSEVDTKSSQDSSSHQENLEEGDEEDLWKPPTKKVPVL